MYGRTERTGAHQSGNPWKGKWIPPPLHWRCKDGPQGMGNIGKGKGKVLGRTPNSSVTVIPTCPSQHPFRLAGSQTPWRPGYCVPTPPGFEPSTSSSGVTCMTAELRDLLAWGTLACARGGGGSGKGALVTGQSQEASPKPLMMTHQLRREAVWKLFFFKKNSPVIRTSK